MDNFYQLLVQKNNSKVQFEELFPSDQKLIETAIAFCNSQGGDLVIGINSENGVVGLDNCLLIKFREKILDVLYQNCFPHIIPEIYNLNYENKDLLIVHFYPSMQKPHYLRSKGKQEGTYIRSGAENKKASAYDLQKFDIYKRGQSFELSSDSDITFEFEIFTIFCQHIIDKLDIEPDIEFFEKWKLIKKEGEKYKLTNLGILLSDLSNEIFPSFNIKCIKKSSETNQIIDETINNGDLLTLLERTYSYVENNLNIENNRDLIIEISKELILNAIVHRDYFQKDDGIKVEIDDSSVKVLSPGNIWIDINSIFQGVHFFENPYLREILSAFQIKNTGKTGFKRIEDIIKNEMQINISFNFFDNYSIFTIYKGHINDPENGINNTFALSLKTGSDPKSILKVPNNVAENSYNNYSDPKIVYGVPNDRYEIILNSMKDNRFVSIKKISSKALVSEKTIKRDIEKLKQNGIVRRVGQKRNGFWEVTG